MKSHELEDSGPYYQPLEQIQEFTSDGQYVTRWGSYSSGDAQFGEAKGMATDPVGAVYVADGTLSRVQKFTDDGDFIMKWGGFGFDPGQLNFPFGVATRGLGEIYVLEVFNHRVSKFSLAGSS